MTPGLDDLPVGPERPERVPEHAARVVLLLQRRDARPVRAKGRHHARRGFVSAQELRRDTRRGRGQGGQAGWKGSRGTYGGERPTEGDGANGIPQPLGFGRDQCDADAGGENGAQRTSSAVSTQRGSSMPMSHWCSPAIVNAASRCDLGTHVPSKSAIAPPASSNSHAVRARG